MRLDTDLRNQHRTRLARAHIVKQLSGGCDELRLEDVAKAAQTAPYYLHRIFRAVTGKSIQRYIRELRLDLAACGVFYTDASISEIAHRSGYDSNEGFTRAFRSQFGRPPSELRNVSRACRRLDQGILPSVAAKPLGSRVAYVRYSGSYTQVSQAWRNLYDRLARLSPEPNQLEPIGIIYDSPINFRSGHILYDACARVSDKFAPCIGIEVQEIPDRELAVMPTEALPELLALAHLRLTVRAAPEHGVRNVSPVPCYEYFSSWPLVADVPVPVTVCIGIDHRGGRGWPPGGKRSLASWR